MVALPLKNRRTFAIIKYRNCLRQVRIGSPADAAVGVPPLINFFIVEHSLLPKKIL